MSDSSTSQPTNPLRVGLLLFPGFQALDAFGPIDCLNVLSRTQTLTLSILSHTLDPVTTRSPFNPDAIAQSVVPTHTFSNAPPLDVLLVPGGQGTRCLDTDPIKSAIKFIADIHPSLKYLITVCTGSGLVAQSGVLDGRRATTNKMGFAEVKRWRSQVDWVAKARWVVDGNIWTSSGVSAGIDVTLAWMEAVYGEEIATNIANWTEYRRSEEASEDPFAELYGLS